jgi:hypothetical protein
MSYDRVNPTYYQTFQQGTPFEAGAPGWSEAPWVTWGNNPNLGGRRKLATDGLGKIVAISGLGEVPTPPYVKGHPPADAVSYCGRLGGGVRGNAAGGTDCVLPGGKICDVVETYWGRCPGVPRAYSAPLAPGQPAMTFPSVSPLRAALGTVAAAACAYHGYRRNESAGWALGWAFFGSVAPILALPIALAQGFGKPRASSPRMAANRSRRRARR